MVLLDLLPQVHLRPEVITYNAVASACASAGRWEAALSILEALRGKDLATAASYGAAISACASEKAGRWQQALLVLQMLREDSQRSEVLSADAVAFGAAISTCGNCGQWEYALHIFSEMQGHIDLDVVACNAVISACEKCEKWQQACFLLAEMGGFGIRPNAVTFNAAVSACGAAGEWEYSLSLFQKMQLSGLHPDTISHNAVITAFEAGCQWQMAWQLLWEREQGGSCDVVGYSSAISACYRARSWQRALLLFQRLEERQLEANAVALGASVAACEAGNLGQEARKVV
ncbi:MRL1 [Symbiodinium microadriaticum]|nr:MRL1 [Symbiodinium microadriaticum]